MLGDQGIAVELFIWKEKVIKMKNVKYGILQLLFILVPILIKTPSQNRKVPKFADNTTINVLRIAMNHSPPFC